MKTNRLFSFLLAVAGVNDPLVFDPALPRDALHRAATVGAAMLVTTLFAFLAATTSALMVLHDQPWRFALAPAFGLLWAAAIFAIDRALILSMAQLKWPALLLRLLLAILIAVSISVPIDIALFQERVEAQLLENRQNADLASQRRLELRHGIDGAREQTAAARAEVQRLEQAAAVWPPGVVEAQQQARLCEAAFERSRLKAQRQLAAIDEKRADLQQRLPLLNGVNPPPVERIQALIQQRHTLGGQRERIEADLGHARKACDAAQATVHSAQRQYLDENRAQQQGARAALARARDDERQRAETASAASAAASQVIDQAMSNNFVVKAEALHQLVTENGFVRTVYVLVLVLWVTLELAPVVAKAMAGTSSIDVVLTAKARALELKHLSRIEQEEEEVLSRRVILEALRERLPEFARENGDALRALFEERLSAQRVLTAHQELLKQLAELLEMTAAQRQRVKRADLGMEVSDEVMDAIATLERAAANSIHSAFAGVHIAPAES
jgi:hypothetical protein